MTIITYLFFFRARTGSWFRQQPQGCERTEKSTLEKLVWQQKWWFLTTHALPLFTVVCCCPYQARQHWVVGVFFQFIAVSVPYFRGVRGQVKVMFQIAASGHWPCLHPIKTFLCLCHWNLNPMGTGKTNSIFWWPFSVSEDRVEYDLCFYRISMAKEMAQVIKTLGGRPLREGSAFEPFLFCQLCGILMCSGECRRRHDSVVKWRFDAENGAEHPEMVCVQSSGDGWCEG